MTGTNTSSGSAVADLTAMMMVDDPYVADGRDDHDELRLAAANERLAEQRSQVRALDLRAKDLGIEKFTDRADLIPLLFAHSVYKSYPESFVATGRWKQLSAWLDSVTTGDVSEIDVSDCTDVDDWLERLDQNGFHVIVSSGTSGKNSFLPMNDTDLEVLATTGANMVGYPHRIPHKQDRPVIILGPSNARMRYKYGHQANAAAYGRPGAVHSLTDEPMLVSDTLIQVNIRRAMSDGTATPSEIAAYQADQKVRSEQMRQNVEKLIATVLSYRDEPQVIIGPWAMAWRLLEAGHAAGLSENVLHPESAVNIAGGLKGLDLPEDYADQIDRFLGPVHRQMIYTFSEQTVAAVMCEQGVYHWPKAVELFILDETGEHLEEIGADGRVTGRVGAYDPIWSGRWGGIISGDKATANYTPCPCGRIGPTIEDSVVRYSELSAGGDDKLTCGGSIEQYIRGIEPVAQT
ncbi:hypothetical protein [Mycobacterium sp.]|uniref:hypothetical protein n=1 Tax=Mycobacterium sp. TaxID=1785 RepID=UPI003D095E60